MKKTLLAAAFFALPGVLCAQGFYLKGGVGYALPVAGQTLDGGGMPYAGSISQVTNTNVSLQYSVKKVSFASGGQLSLGAGYMFNANLGVELNASVGVALRKFESTYNREDQTINTYAKHKYTQYASAPVILSPSAVIQVQQNSLTLYARGGVALPVSNKLIFTADVQESYDPSQAARTGRVTSEIKTRFGLGFSGAMGVRYPIADNIELWGEAAFLSLSLYTKEEHVTEYMVNGQNVLSYLSPTDLHHTYDMDGNSNDITTSTQSPAYSVPFSNVALNLGIAFTF